MHDQLRQDLSQAIDDMSEAQKLELIEELAHSMRHAPNDEPEAQALQRQRECFRRLQGTLATIPRGKDPYAHLGYSNEAHDKILYDLEQK
jgi:hypothetical protein